MPPSLILALALTQAATTPPLVTDEVRRPLRGSSEAAGVIDPETAESKPLVSTGKMEKLRPVNGVDRFKFQGVVPAGFHLVVNHGLLNAGIITFAVAYLPFAIGAPLAQSPALLIPFAGPLIGYRREVGLVPPAIDVLILAILVTDVVAQVGGAILIFAGAIAPTRWLERDAQVSLVPMAPGAAFGASLVGRY